MNRFAMACLAATISVCAQAGSVIDQEQTAVNTGGFTSFATFSQPDLAQSFKPGYNNVTGASLLLSSIGVSGTVTISLYDALPNNSGNLLASGSATGLASSWVDVTFTTSASATIGDTLFLVFTGDPTLGVLGSIDNPYADGQAYAGAGYGSFPTFDYTFRTFSDDGNGGGNGQVIPAPAAAGAGLIGLVGLVGRRRRK